MHQIAIAFQWGTAIVILIESSFIFVNLKPQGYLLKPPTRDTLMAAIGKWI